MRLEALAHRNVALRSANFTIEERAVTRTTTSKLTFQSILEVFRGMGRMVSMIFKYWFVLNINPDLDYPANPMVTPF
jgi:hypothetical protein